jgi:ADP-ribose pyrophosphatase YjhB (NUDIX family)
MSMKIISRAILTRNNSVLLVKNVNKDYWSLPGGYWEWDKETLKECATRELLEETGCRVYIKDLLFVQEFESKSSKVIEFVWSASIKQGQKDIKSILHKDIDTESEIEQIKWFNFDTLEEISVRPAAVKSVIRGESVPLHIKS